MQPPSFLWGAATSAHQVEGNNDNNDWWQWEKSGGRERSGRAADHYRRYKEDFALAKALGHNAHRLSLEWSRIEPLPGQWSRPAIEHYRQVLEELRRLNLRSFVTLHHFTNPMWLANKGGWMNAATPERFRQYVNFVVQHLGDLVDFWITINEPIVYASNSYWQRRWPPQQRGLGKLLTVIGRMGLSHRLAYHTIHLRRPDARVGIAKHCIAYLPEHRWRFGDYLALTAENWWFNHRFFELTKESHDFIGVNYYFPAKKRLRFSPPLSDVGWPIYPQGLTQVMLEMKRYGKPIYITENGVADAADSKRADFIRSHLRAVEAAQEQGVDVRGYLYWSLLDNFEWDSGFSPRFGLIEVDYETQERTIRPSAYVYKAIIEQSNQ